MEANLRIIIEDTGVNKNPRREIIEIREYILRKHILKWKRKEEKKEEKTTNEREVEELA